MESTSPLPFVIRSESFRHCAGVRGREAILFDLACVGIVSNHPHGDARIV